MGQGMSECNAGVDMPRPNAREKVGNYCCYTMRLQKANKWEWSQIWTDSTFVSVFYRAWVRDDVMTACELSVYCPVCVYVRACLRACGVCVCWCVCL